MFNDCYTPVIITLLCSSSVCLVVVKVCSVYYCLILFGHIFVSVFLLSRKNLRQIFPRLCAFMFCTLGDF